MDKKAITETRVRMRNAIMTMKGKFKIANTLMMVVSLCPWLERLLVCVYAITQDIASASDFGKNSELKHGPSLWSGKCRV